MYLERFLIIFLTFSMKTYFVGYLWNFLNESFLIRIHTIYFYWINLGNYWQLTVFIWPLKNLDGSRFGGGGSENKMIYLFGVIFEGECPSNSQIIQHF